MLLFLVQITFCQDFRPLQSFIRYVLTKVVLGACKGYWTVGLPHRGGDSPFPMLARVVQLREAEVQAEANHRKALRQGKASRAQKLARTCATLMPCYLFFCVALISAAILAAGQGSWVRQHRFAVQTRGSRLPSRHFA